MTELQHEIPRLVARHGEEIDATYAMLKKTNKKVNKIASVQKKHGDRLDRIEGRLDGIDGRLDDHGGKLDEILGILRKEG